MKNTSPLLLLCLVPLLSGGCERADTGFTSHWSGQPDRLWAGPDTWANRLQDWRLEDGRVEATGRGPFRTLHLLTRRIGAGNEPFETSVTLGPLPADGERTVPGRAGLLLGVGAGMDYRAAALVHHSPGPGGGWLAGIDESGRTFIRGFGDDTTTHVHAESGMAYDSARLTVTGGMMEGTYVLSARADLFGETTMGHTVTTAVDGAALAGGIALFSDAPREHRGSWFRDWRVNGERIERHEGRAFGPVAGAQHTLSRGTLKLTAQLMPVGGEDAGSAELQIRDGAEWRTLARAPVIVPGYTATFRVTDWADTVDTPYRIAYALMGPAEEPDIRYYGGVIRRDPDDEPEIVVAAFTGNHNISRPVPGEYSGVGGGWFPWSRAVWFPHADIVRHARAHDPDFLFFSGDQVYEGASPTPADLSHPTEDYLYKWYLWHWAFAPLTADIPSVTVPDDHDVYHGNIWGAGAIATPPGLTGAAAQDRGGYKLPPVWVNMVQRTQTSHLPDPFDPEPAAQGIGVYYTDILYGGVSFAVIEDRKFKSAPAPLIPAGDIWNGWPRAPGFDPKTQADVPGAVLLGERQLTFLDEWANDWSGGAWMKVVLSQTPFAGIATLPDSALTGSIIPSLPILEPGEYPEGERFTSDMDTNGWPQSGRDRAIRAMRKGFAVHLAGDQHLGSTVQYGVDDWGDAGFVISVPSIANFWPRRWFPPRPGANRDPQKPRYTGDFEDGFGNRMTVHAVSNPVRSGHEPAVLHDLAPGYGIARFQRETRHVSLAAWPRWADPVAGGAPYPGWPVEFEQREGYGRTPAGYLPVINVAGMRDPVVQIIDEATGEYVYTLRITGSVFRPRIFTAGPHTVGVGEPGTERWATLTAVMPTGNADTIAVDLRR